VAEAPAPFTFFIDEHLPVRILGRILTSRGHIVQAVQVAEKDPSILVTAEAAGAIIVTADTWFLKELFRYPQGHARRYLRAGVIQVAGEWGKAQPRLEQYLPMIEVICQMRKHGVDPRVGIDLSGSTIRIIDPANE
jgi:hypothetical protein